MASCSRSMNQTHFHRCECIQTLVRLHSLQTECIPSAVWDRDYIYIYLRVYNFTCSSSVTTKLGGVGLHWYEVILQLTIYNNKHTIPQIMQKCSPGHSHNNMHRCPRILADPFHYWTHPLVGVMMTPEGKVHFVLL